MKTHRSGSSRKVGGVMDCSDEKSKTRGCFLSPDWTIGYFIREYPLARVVIKKYFGDIPESMMNSTLLDFRNQLIGHDLLNPYMVELLAISLNNVVGSLYGAPLLPGPSDWLHCSGPAPKDFWTESPQPVELTEDQIGIMRRHGLGIPHYWACNGAFSAHYTAATGEIDAMACYNWKSAPIGSQLLFPKGFLKFGANKSPHSFQDACLWPFGFESRWGTKREHRATLVLEGRSFFLELKAKGSSWVTLDWNARRQREGMLWRAKGWDRASGTFVVYVSHMFNRAAADSLYYPPFPDGFSREEISALTNDKQPMECGIDRLQSGNLFLLISADGLKPQIEEDGIWRWAHDPPMLFQISAGTTYDEALAEWRRGQASGIAVNSCKDHYRQISRRGAAIRMPGHRNIEAIAATAPPWLESLKLEGDHMMRYGANAGFMDPHTSFLCMRTLLYGGDYDHVDNFIAFLSDPVRRGPQGQIAEMLAYDSLPDHFFLKWSFQDVSWLALIGHLEWHGRDRQTAKYYTAGREHLLRILSDTDDSTCLFRSFGKWPDLQLFEVGRKGRPWVAWESGLWYEALRNWELLTARQGDAALALRLGQAAQKLKASFQPLFYEPDVGFICDSVDPETKKRHPHYSGFHLNFLCGMFGQELFDGTAMRGMAEAAYRGLYDPGWKTFRISLQAGPFHSELESKDVSWMFAALAKLFRHARHQEGLRAILDGYEFHYGKLLHYLESFNMFPTLATGGNGGEAGFDCGLASRYQTILEGFYGINLAPDNLGIFPLGLNNGKAMQLDHLPVGKSRWSFSYSGTGAWPVEIRLDGENYPASWVFPSGLLEGGVHKVEVSYGETLPQHPILLEAAGLELIDAGIMNSMLIARFRGPGRACLRFWSPSRPTLMQGGKPLEIQWDSVGQYAVAELFADDLREIEVLVSASC
ncbi:MAG: hypothetical protein WAX69_17720 [Victivallales bacterium]